MTSEARHLLVRRRQKSRSLASLVMTIFFAANVVSTEREQYFCPGVRLRLWLLLLNYYTFALLGLHRFARTQQ
jgi:hypothetical protein